jgi:hypothetical protein
MVAVKSDSFGRRKAAFFYPRNFRLHVILSTSIWSLESVNLKDISNLAHNLQNSY